MEDLKDFSFSGPSAKDIASELRDELYFKMVSDFSGPQTGDFLDLGARSCTNRLLVQVGLMREENDLSWVDVVKWLQKIFPMFKSADFHCLIDRNTETAVSLTGGARKSFLGSEVNFEFIGPICDSIGIGRTDLLKMTDFSDRAKLTDVTNGLILELTNFIAREQIDPVVLVSWLRNFDPTFCSDGKIQKANKILKSSLKRFRLKYRNNQRSRNRNNGLLDEFLRSPFDFTSDLDDTEFRRVSIIKGQLRRKRLKLFKQKSHFQTNEPREEHTQAGYRKNKYALESDSMSEPEQAETLDINENPQFDTGDCVNLLDVSILSMQKLADMYGGMSDRAKLVSLDLLKHHFSLMLKESVLMKSLNDKIMAHVLLKMDQCVVPPLNFLQCNALFLFDFIDAVEKKTMLFEREIANTTGEKLGRDSNPKFQSFMNFDESAVTRYIHMVCDILCPREEISSSYRRHWVAFCIERNNPSKLPVNQSNRFINYFEAAAALMHHCRDVALFVSDLQQLNDDSNIILDSINADASDEAVQALVCVVAIVYCKVLGPFWQLLKSDAQYLLFSKYMLCLYRKLLKWSDDASILLQPETSNNVFLQVPIQEKKFSGMFAFCHSNEDNQYGTLIKACLQSMMKVLAAVMEKNLKEFLPGGKYCKEPSAELAKQLSDCTFSQLMGEYPFGHAYPYNKNRPDKTYLETVGSVAEEPSEEPTPSPPKKPTSPEVSSGSSLKQRTSESNIMFDRADMLLSKKKGSKKLMDKSQISQRQDQVFWKMIAAKVAKNGGPCKSVEDVDRLLVRLKGKSHVQKREAIRSELNYQKYIGDLKGKLLSHVGLSLKDMINSLKSIFPNEKCSAASIITKTNQNVTILVGSIAGQMNTTAPDTPKQEENPTVQPP